MLCDSAKFTTWKDKIHHLGVTLPQVKNH